MSFKHAEVEGSVSITNEACDAIAEVKPDSLGDNRLYVDANLTATPSPGSSPTAFTKNYRMRLVEDVNLTNNAWVEVYRRGTIGGTEETGRVDSLHLLCNTKPYDVRVVIDGNNITQDIDTDVLDATGLTANGNFAGTVRMYVHNNQASAFGITIDWAPGGILYAQEFYIEIKAHANGKKMLELLIHQNEDT
jgi:hypothetical protein